LTKKQADGYPQERTARKKGGLQHQKKTNSKGEKRGEGGAEISDGQKRWVGGNRSSKGGGRVLGKRKGPISKVGKGGGGLTKTETVTKHEKQSTLQASSRKK